MAVGCTNDITTRKTARSHPKRNAPVAGTPDDTSFAEQSLGGRLVCIPLDLVGSGLR
jgi:hypothetical protein